MTSVGVMALRMRRPLLAAGAALLALTLATACSPTPAPTPSPTGFASEEEAFAAAEATYRAYVDALNARRLNRDSMPSPTDFLTGAALAAEIESEQNFAQLGRSLVGVTSIHSVRNISAADESAEIGVCLDASHTRVIDEDGVDVTPPDRPNLLGLLIDVVWTPTQPYISSTSASDEQC